MILLQSPDGSERVLVESMDGYDGWEVIAEPCDPPDAFHYWDGESWALDTDAQKRHEMLQLTRDPDKLAVLLADLMARLPSQGE